MAFAHEQDRLVQGHEQFERYVRVQAIDPAGVESTTQNTIPRISCNTHMCMQFHVTKLITRQWTD